jgi:hypothetical protein
MKKANIYFPSGWIRVSIWRVIRGFRGVLDYRLRCCGTTLNINLRPSYLPSEPNSSSTGDITSLDKRLEAGGPNQTVYGIELE